MAGENEKRGAWVTLKALPWVGDYSDKLHKMVQAFGWAVVLATAIGFLVAAGLVCLGWYPAWAVSKRLRQLPAAAEQAPPKIKPTGIEIQVSRDDSNWMTPYIYWLEAEGDSFRKQGRIAGYMVKLIESRTLPATDKFVWVLRPSPGFDISGYAFRSMTLDGSEVFEPLTLEKDSGSAGSVRATVPPCSNGYKLVGIIRIAWKQEQKPADFLDTFRSLPLLE